MLFHFMYPVIFKGADGAKRIVGEVELEAEIEGPPDNPKVVALYSSELGFGGERFRIDAETDGFLLPMKYLASNPQEQERLAAEWEAHVAENYPAERSRGVHEESTYWGRP